MLGFNVDVSKFQRKAPPPSTATSAAPETSGSPESSETSSPPKPWLRLLLGDGLAGFIIYSILFVCLFSSTSNALQFGRLIQLAIRQPDDEVYWQTKNETLGQNQADPWAPEDVVFERARIESFEKIRRFQANAIGFITFSILCLIGLWYPSASRSINRWTSILKLGAIVGLIIYGASSYAFDGNDDDKDNQCMVSKGNSGSQIANEDSEFLKWVRVLLQILFSFQGWENATFVSECPPSPIVCFPWPRNRRAIERHTVVVIANLESYL
jgi:amino acid transporter